MTLTFFCEMIYENFNLVKASTTSCSGACFFLNFFECDSTAFYCFFDVTICNVETVAYRFIHIHIDHLPFKKYFSKKRKIYNRMLLAFGKFIKNLTLYYYRLMDIMRNVELETIRKGGHLCVD